MVIIDVRFEPVKGARTGKADTSTRDGGGRVMKIVSPPCWFARCRRRAGTALRMLAELRLNDVVSHGSQRHRQARRTHLRLQSANMKFQGIVRRSKLFGTRFGTTVEIVPIPALRKAVFDTLAHLSAPTQLESRRSA